MKSVHVIVLYAGLAFTPLASAQNVPMVGEEFLVAGQEWRMMAVKFLHFDTREEWVLTAPVPVPFEWPGIGELVWSRMWTQHGACADNYPVLLADARFRKRRVSGYDAFTYHFGSNSNHGIYLPDDQSGTLNILVSTYVYAYIDVGPRMCLTFPLFHELAFTHDISRENTVTSTEDIREGGIYDSLNLRDIEVDNLLDLVSIRPH